MRMTVQTDYALRVLMQLAVIDQRLTIDDISQAYDISRNHVMKIVQKLVARGYVDSMRGRNGGLLLARAPSEINVGEVVRDMEEVGHFVECFDSETNSCVVSLACGLQHVLNGAVQKFLGHLDQFTIADLLRRPNDFRLLLSQREPAT